MIMFKVITSRGWWKTTAMINLASNHRCAIIVSSYKKAEEVVHAIRLAWNNRFVSWVYVYDDYMPMWPIVIDDLEDIIWRFKNVYFKKKWSDIVLDIDKMLNEEFHWLAVGYSMSIEDNKPHIDSLYPINEKDKALEKLYKNSWDWVFDSMKKITKV